MGDTNGHHTRLNIYLDDPALRTQVKIAAALKCVSVSAYCLEAIRRRLAEDGLPLAPTRKYGMTPQEAAADMDRLREEIGPLGFTIQELIDEGRNR